MPITCMVLKRILESTHNLSWFSQLNFEAAVTAAFSGFLRCGKFTIQPGKAFDPSIHLTRSCVAFVPSISAPLYAVLTGPSSNMDPFRKGVAITIARAPGARTCTVSALKSLLECSEQPLESPLFTGDDGAPLARGHFIAKLKECLLKAGYNPSNFSGQSFHRGATSSAAAIGFNDHEIQQLGRWRSDSYKLYIDSSQAQLLSLSSCLHWAIPHSQLFKPPSLHLLSSLA